MRELTRDQLADACRRFMDLAYPGGPDTIPARRRCYYDPPPDAPLTALVPPAPAAAGLCESLAGPPGGSCGYAFRLGSAHFPHLKLRVQQLDHRGTLLWVWAVDTHDALPRMSLAADAAEAACWRELQEKNAELKVRIEDALERAGFLTFKTLLRLDLPAPSAP